MFYSLADAVNITRSKKVMQIIHELWFALLSYSLFLFNLYHKIFDIECFIIIIIKRLDILLNMKK